MKREPWEEKHWSFSVGEGAGERGGLTGKEGGEFCEFSRELLEQE